MCSRSAPAAISGCDLLERLQGHGPACLVPSWIGCSSRCPQRNTNRRRSGCFGLCHDKYLRTNESHFIVGLHRLREPSSLRLVSSMRGNLLAWPGAPLALLSALLFGAST